MKYSKSDGAYFRKRKKENSIKGGKLRGNGKLEVDDFSNNVVLTQKIDTNPIKVMKQRLTDEPYIFFGYDAIIEKYQYVCYNNMNPFSKNTIPIKCKQLVLDRNIFVLRNAEFLNIGIKELIVLCYNFLMIRQYNHRFMNRLFEYLDINVFNKVLETKFPNSNNYRMYKNMVEKIGEMQTDEGHRIFNQRRGGKLDVDGRLDKDDFDLEKNIAHSTEMYNYENASLPKIVRSNRNNQKQNIQNHQTVFPKEIIKKGFHFTNEPYIFFGYDTRIGKYRYVCYNSLTNKPIFRKLEDNGEISDELTLDQIKEIDLIEIVKLFCFLNKKNKPNGYKYMKRLQDFILRVFNYRISKSNFNAKIRGLNNLLKNYISECFNIK
jgi:hypothetical protein